MISHNPIHKQNRKKTNKQKKSAVYKTNKIEGTDTDKSINEQSNKIVSRFRMYLNCLHSYNFINQFYFRLFFHSMSKDIFVHDSDYLHQA